MANLCFVSDGLPRAPTPFQPEPDLFSVNRFAHAVILVKHSLESKEHFTNPLRHAQPMEEKSINEVVAESVRYWMDERKLKQTPLAEKAHVSQKTISNVLHPDQRSKSKSGKEPSVKLTELARIAQVLDVEVWQLIRPISDSERKMYEAIEVAYKKLLASAIPVTQTQEAAAPNDQDKAAYEASKLPPRRRKPQKPASDDKNAA